MVKFPKERCEAEISGDDTSLTLQEAGGAPAVNGGR